MIPLIDLKIGPNLFQLHTYALLISTALFIMFITLIVALKKCHLSVPRVLLGTVLTLVMAVVGSRTLYYVLYPPNDLAGLWAIFKPNFFGFTLYGGILGAVLVLWYLSKKWHFRLFGLMDHMLVGTGIGLMVSRLGCWFNGCCYGKVTTMPWGIQITKGSFAHKAYINENPFNLLTELPSIHPTQLYELLVVLIALSIGAFLLVEKRTGEFSDGIPSILFGIVLTMGRFIVFMFRSFPYATITSNYIRGPIIYGITLLILLILLKQSLTPSEIRQSPSPTSP